MLLAELERLRPGLTLCCGAVRPGGAWRSAGLRRRWSTRWRPGHQRSRWPGGGSLGLACDCWRRRSTGGRWQVPAGYPAGRARSRGLLQIAAWMARHVGGRAQVARGGLAPLSSRESVLPADHGRTARTGPVVPVPGSPGNLRRGCERWPGGSDFQGGTVSAYVRPGSTASASAGRWLSGVPGRVQTAVGTVRRSWTQLDLMGHDPEPASR